jgi:hypothetical protein
LLKRKRIALPKEMGGWGLKYFHQFAKALATKCVWRLSLGKGLWSKVVSQKYIELDTVDYWIRRPTKSFHNVSIIWNDVVLAFPLIGRWLEWRVGKETRVRLGEDPWVVCDLNFRLSINLIQILHEKGFCELCRVVDLDLIIFGDKWKNACMIGIMGHEALEWDAFITSLISFYLRIKDVEDEFV